jgi:hypothetical protein
MEYVGFDLGKVNSQICLITEDGELIEKRLKTERETLAQFFGQRSEKVCVLIEASTESEWVARCLEELGCQVVVADPNFAPMDARRSKKVKTDRLGCPSFVRSVPVGCTSGGAPDFQRGTGNEEFAGSQRAISFNALALYQFCQKKTSAVRVCA